MAASIQRDLQRGIDPQNCYPLLRKEKLSKVQRKKKKLLFPVLGLFYHFNSIQMLPFVVFFAVKQA